jgi:hypothetical protein
MLFEQALLMHVEVMAPARDRPPFEEHRSALVRFLQLVELLATLEPRAVASLSITEGASRSVRQRTKS